MSSLESALLKDATPHGYDESFSVELHQFGEHKDALLYRKKDGTPFLIEAYADEGWLYLQAEVNKDIVYDGAYIHYHRNGKPHIETSKTPNSHDSRWSMGPYKEYYEDGTLKVDGNKGDGTLRTSREFCGLMREFYPNGNLKASTTYNNRGQKEGHYREFSEDGTPKLEAVYQPFGYGYQYLNSTFVGPYKEFYPNGKVRVEGIKAMYGDVLSIENCFVGVVKDYYENGNLKSENTYTGTEQRDDARVSASMHQGMCREYDAEGRRTRSYMVKNGEMLGAYTEYWPNGKVKIDGALTYNFEKDKTKLAFDGAYKEYYEDGALKIDGTRKGNYGSNFNGTYKEYHPNGQLMIDGTRVGYGNYADCRKEFYASGQLKCESNYATRTYYSTIPGTHLSGPYKEFAEDGTPILDCTYDYELKGPYKKYDEKGHLIIDAIAAGKSTLTFEGPYREYHPNGTLKIETTAKSHFEGWHGTGKYETLFVDAYTEYHDNGQLKIEAKRDPETGKFSGQYLGYHENGALKIKAISDSRWLGDFEGAYEEYHPNGYLSLKATKKYGRLEGDYEEYHDNGFLKCKGTIAANRDFNKKSLRFAGAFAEYHKNRSLFFATDDVVMSLEEMQNSSKREWRRGVTIHPNGKVAVKDKEENAWRMKDSAFATGDRKGFIACYKFRDNDLQVTVAPPEELVPVLQLSAPRLLQTNLEELVRDSRAIIYALKETLPLPEAKIA
jgi:antitoxin component YwqK of YwqJK toxin-antitoxin module